MNTKILATTDYDQFKTKKGNRPVSKSYVRYLMAGIKIKNMLSVNPIIVNEEMEIIDGQHRLECARRLNIPIYYVVFNPASLSEIQLLNSNVRRWTFLNFVESYVETGVESYKVFKDFYEKYSFPFTIAVALLIDPESLTMKKGMSQMFREGRLEIIDLEKSIERAEYLKEFLGYAHGAVQKSNRFYEAMFYLMRECPDRANQLMSKLIDTGIKIYRTDSRNDYIRQFEDVLNKGNYGKRIIIY